jgi:hypothetical protein
VDKGFRVFAEVSPVLRLLPVGFCLPFAVVDTADVFGAPFSALAVSGGGFGAGEGPFGMGLPFKKDVIEGDERVNVRS